MKCHKCNSENNDGAKFCHKCGTRLKRTKSKTKKPLMNQQQIIITIISVIIIILAGAVLSYTNILAPQPTLQTKDFGAFAISVPEGSNFVLKEKITQIPGRLYVGYINKGNWGNQISTISVSENKVVPTSTGELLEDNGNQKIFANKSSYGTIYTLYEDKGSCGLMIIGKNLNLLKEMAKTFQIKNLDSLRTSTPTSTPQTSATPTSSGPINILGGSFSTGSGTSDKTYATINVGTSHAGESYTVQILYSRDGKGLNNGNMVPVSVHSDGCIYVTSAEAYKFYPDHATIKIYDNAGNLLTSKSVSLYPGSGTQTF